MNIELKSETNILQNPFIAFLKLIRIENLLIIGLTQYLIRYGVIDSLLVYNGEKLYLQLSHLDFFLLTLSTVMIAAAGYIINDYFDVKTDKINRPDTVVIDKGIKRRVAMAAHLIINFIGIALGVYVAMRVGNVRLGILHVMCAGLLWYYSTNFKKQLLIGNIIVSVLTGLVPLIVILYDIPPVIEFYSRVWPDEPIQFVNMYKYILAFSGFAFLTSLIREIIKDMEDYQGDLATGCNTVPIAWGMRSAKAIVIGIISNTVLLLSVIVYKLYSPNDRFPTYYLMLTVILPLVFLIYRIYRAQVSRDYKRASILVKIIMLTGVSFSFIIFYLAHYA
jgi:4-hydroxybenzoate polyprenyltransferase